MADAGDLAKLPAEIRKEIYAHLLMEPKKIPITRCPAEDKKSNNQLTHGATARMDKLRRPKVPGKRYDRHLKAWVLLPPSTTSPLKVNKLIGLEAAQVLYGFNRFEFQNAGALERFLEQIGHGASHLRHVAIIGEGYKFAGSWAAMVRSLKALATSKSIRTLGFSHLIFCLEADEQTTALLRMLAEHCKPLLETLRAHFNAQNLDFDVLDIVKIDLPPYPDVSPYHWSPIVEFGQQNIVTLASCNKRGFEMRSCWCHKSAAGGKNDELMVELKKEIMRQLGISSE